MAFNDTYRESIQSKHLSNVGFTSTAKGVTNEAYALKNPHQVLATQIPTTDIVTEYGPLTASGVASGDVEEHVVKLTADPTVNNNKAWIAYEDNCQTTGHSARGHIRIDQWMRYAETQYKLRLFEDNGTGTGYDSNKEILPSEPSFNWEYDASAGIVYFDEDPSDNGKTLPLWGVFYVYVGDTVADSLASVSGTLGDHNHDDRYYTKTELDAGQLDNRYYTETEVDAMLATTSGTLQDQIDDTYTQAEVDAKDTAISGSLQNDIIWEETWSGVIQPKAGDYWGDPIYTPGDVTIGGDLVVSGTRFISNTETVEIEDNLLVINSGEQGAGVTDGLAGIQVDRGTSPDYFFLYDENQDNFRVGVSGTLQAVATREDSPTANIVPWWNDTEYRFDTAGTTFISVDTSTPKITSSVNSKEWVDVSDSYTEIFASTNSAQSNNASLRLTGGTAIFYGGDGSSSTSAQFAINNNGMTLAAGASVNDITTAIVYPGDDDTLATEKAIVDYVDTVSGTLSNAADALDIYKYFTDGVFTAEASGNTDTFTISGTGGTSVTITAASDLLTIDSFDAFLDLTDTPGAYTANNTLYMTAAGLASNATVTYDPNNSEFNVGGVFSLATGTTVNEIVSTVDSASTDDQLATAGSVFDLVSAVSGTLSDATTALDFYKYITDGSNTAAADGNDDTLTFAATGGASVTVNAGTDTITIDAFDTFLELTDTPSSYTANNMLFMTGSAVADTSAITYNPTTSGVAIAHDLTVNGTLGLASGTTINEISTAISSTSTDDQVATAKATYDYVDTVSGTLSDATTALDFYKSFTDGSNTADADGNDDTFTFAATGGASVSIDSGSDTLTIDALDTFLELTDTPSSYTANNMFYMTASGVEATSDMTYDPTTSGVSFAQDVSVGGDLSLASGTSVNEIATSVGSNTDDQLITAKAVEDYVDGQMNLVDAYKFVTNGTTSTTASGLDTLTINGSLGIGIGVDPTTDTVTISGSSQPVAYEAELTYNAGGGYWAYSGGFSSVPSDMEVFLNGVKNKKDSDYYTATVVGGELRITFAFDTYAEDWANVTYGTIWNGSKWVNITATANISSGQRIIVDTSSSGAYTLTLPSNPSMGDEIHFLDGGYNCGTDNVTIARNGNNIMGLAQNMDIDTDGAAFKLVYYNSTRGWVIY